MSVMQDLYDSEINFTVSTVWDAGFEVGLGDSSDGFVAAETFQRWDDVEPWLVRQAILHFPDSDFARKCRGN